MSAARPPEGANTQVGGGRAGVSRDQGGQSSDAPQTIEISLVAHTNAGKTTLARTLLGRDIGEVRDAPHVTDVAESHVLVETPAGDVLRLWDTPGFGDSARLARRMRGADNPVGWFLREVWDRFRDRPLWCSQQAVRAARETSDVVLYLANATEDPRDAGYVGHEMQVLAWVGKPVIVLLNQVGPPRPAAEERADEERWRGHLAGAGIVSDVLTLDAFARCWVQEHVLLDAIGARLPQAKRAAYVRLQAQWRTRNTERFDAAIDALAEHVAAAARDAEPIVMSDTTTANRVLSAVGIGRGEEKAASERAMQALAGRLDRSIRGVTDRLIALHGLDGSAAATILARLAQNFATTKRVDEGRAALWGSVLTGALTGLKADLATGGLTFGAGMLVGGIIGGLGGAGLARGFNKLTGADEPRARWSEAFLDGLVRSSLLRYLAVAHFGRGRGRWVEGEAPEFWQEEAERVVSERAEALHGWWATLRDGESREPAATSAAFRDALHEAALDLLERLYPGRARAALGPREGEHVDG